MVTGLAQALFVYCRNALRNLYETNLFHLDEAGESERNEAIRSPWRGHSISRLHISYLVLDVSGRLSSYVEGTSVNQRLREEYQRRIFEHGHWNEAGNRLVAICLYRFLEGKVRPPKRSEDKLQEPSPDITQPSGR